MNFCNYTYIKAHEDVRTQYEDSIKELLAGEHPENEHISQKWRDFLKCGCTIEITTPDYETRIKIFDSRRGNSCHRLQQDATIMTGNLTLRLLWLRDWRKNHMQFFKYEGTAQGDNVSSENDGRHVSREKAYKLAVLSEEFNEKM